MALNTLPEFTSSYLGASWSNVDFHGTVMVGERFICDFFYPDLDQMCGYSSFVPGHKTVGCGVTKFAQINQQHLTGEVEFCKGNH